MAGKRIWSWASPDPPTFPPHFHFMVGHSISRRHFWAKHFGAVTLEQSGTVALELRPERVLHLRTAGNLE
jgi:hypothetical protein